VRVAANLESQREFEFTMFNPDKQTSVRNARFRSNLQFEFLINTTFSGKVAFRSSYEVDSVVEGARNCSLFRR